MSFEEEVRNRIRTIEKRFYVTFFATVVCGLFAHLYQFTTKNFNFDELGQTPAGFGAGIELGRWGLQIVGDTVGLFFRTYSLPMINGMITLICVAFYACMQASRGAYYKRKGKWMLFNTIDFLIFLPIVLVIYYIIPEKYRHI